MLLLLLACAHEPPSPPALPVVGAEVLWYDLTGADRIDLIESCADTCPRDEAGHPVASLTLWAVEWTWQRPPTEPCEVQNVAVAVDATVTLPRWTPPPEADPALVEEWRVYLAALAFHEQGHVDLAHSLATDAEEGVASAGCGGAHAAGRAAVARIGEAQHAYDAATDSGRRQGADFWKVGGRASLVSTR